jgi:hypothetical protein
MSAITLKGFSAQTVVIEAPFPIICVNRASGEPLRMNSQPLDFGADQGGARMSLREIMRKYLLQFCRVWDRQAASFVDAYFVHVARTLEARGPEIEERLRPFDGLYRVEDWFFSAPMPLPRAHLFAPEEPASPVGTEADFVPVDFAFWLGDRMSGALSSQTELTPAKVRQRHSRLTRSGVVLTTFGPGDLVDPSGAIFERAAKMSEALASLGPLPVGPLRRMPLGL